ncbi:hypothetical protein [Streptomyces sp. NPDC101150]|uniref:hypothetical protein n=1 Tax=Streptomyces sp. NPDC101150 TaxID=3366114 RepID=UPI0038138B24
MVPNDPTPAADNDHPATKPKMKESRFSGARARWTEAWSEGGVFHEMWEDVRRVPNAGWHGMANWIKTVAVLAAFSFVVVLIDGAVDVLLDIGHRTLTAVPNVQVGDNSPIGVWATIDNPIRSYIATHSVGLPISAATVYTLWQFTGLFSLIAGFVTRSNGVRLTWTAWGVAGLAMVWTTTPDVSRTVATGLAALVWTFASAFALRGLNLRPHVFANIGAPQVTVQPQIHVPAHPEDPALDNGRQLGR